MYTFIINKILVVTVDYIEIVTVFAVRWFRLIRIRTGDNNMITTEGHVEKLSFWTDDDKIPYSCVYNCVPHWHGRRLYEVYVSCFFFVIITSSRKEIGMMCVKFSRFTLPIYIYNVYWSKLFTFIISNFIIHNIWKKFLIFYACL